MDKDFLRGINFGLGILFVFSLFGVIFAVGFHVADEVLPGTFDGDYNFTGKIYVLNETNLTDSNQTVVTKGYVDGKQGITWDCERREEVLSIANYAWGTVSCSSGYKLVSGSCNQGNIYGAQVRYDSDTQMSCYQNYGSGSNPVDFNFICCK